MCPPAALSPPWSCPLSIINRTAGQGGRNSGSTSHAQRRAWPSSRSSAAAAGALVPAVPSCRRLATMIMPVAAACILPRQAPAAATVRTQSRTVESRADALLEAQRGAPSGVTTLGWRSGLSSAQRPSGGGALSLCAQLPVTSCVGDRLLVPQSVRQGLIEGLARSCEPPRPVSPLRRRSPLHAELSWGLTLAQQSGGTHQASRSTQAAGGAAERR